MRFDGLTTHSASFEAEQQVGEENDAYGDPQPIYDWVVVAEDVPTRFEPAGQGFVSESTGEQTRRAARLFITDVERIGERTADGYYSPLVTGGDRVAVDGIPGRFRITFIRVRSLDRNGPDFVEMELEQID